MSGLPVHFDPVELFISGVGRVGRVTFVLAIFVIQSTYELVRLAPPVAQWVVGWIVYPVLICAAASILSKRLHDRGNAGWWSALPILAYPCIRPWPEGIVGGVCLGIVLWFGVSLAVMPGERGFNRFGPKP